MDYIRKAHERGHVNFGWLDSKHSFSFGNYYDPAHMGISVLRVINDDTVIGGAGFGTHGHRDMEIISYVLEGDIAHKDSEGNEYVIPAGDVQRMTAGTGITHSEFNANSDKRLKFLQIWVLPESQGLKPGYEQKTIAQNGPVTTLVAKGGQNGALHIHQDVRIDRVQLDSGESIALDNGARVGYLHLFAGSAQVNGQTFEAGDAIGVVQLTELTIDAGAEGVKALWFDLPAVQ
ncbi:pirin family protein [Salinibius halmophilus]|uniref:pirin family protein n=1 Tax=Salinibius halmophilus TaxID=1853216 RepID=UPI000E67279E|nr:pirin family protein [Salinibius halmophilus]